RASRRARRDAPSRLSNRAPAGTHKTATSLCIADQMAAECRKFRLEEQRPCCCQAKEKLLRARQLAHKSSGGPRRTASRPFRARRATPCATSTAIADAQGSRSRTKDQQGESEII